MDNKYLISIDVLEENTGKKLGSRSTYSIEIAEQIIGDVQKWIDSYEKENKIECFHCLQSFEESEGTFTSESDFVCNPCAEKLVSGQEAIKETIEEHI